MSDVHDFNECSVLSQVLLYVCLFLLDASNNKKQSGRVKMSCEDIAMNFLISHIAREPQIKVGLGHGIPYYDCPARLSKRPQHYEERTECLNYFSQVFGYNPLLPSLLVSQTGE